MDTQRPPPSPFDNRAAIGGVVALLVATGWLLWHYANFKSGDSLSTGIGIGLLLAGVMLVRRSAYGQAHAWARYGAVLWVPVVFLGSMALMFRSFEDVSPNVALVPQNVFGFGLSLPPWKVKHAPEHAAADALQLEDPKGNGRFLEFRWALGPEEDISELLLQVYTAPPLSMQLLQRTPTTVAGVPAETLYLETPSGGKRVAVTLWRCKGETRNAWLASFLHMDRSALLEFQERVLRTVSCEGPPAAAVPSKPAGRARRSPSARCRAPRAS